MPFSFIQLQDDTSQHKANFIINKTRQDYLKTAGVNSAVIVTAITKFIIKIGVWHPADDIITSIQSASFKPNGLNDISCMMVVYDYIWTKKKAKSKPNSSERTDDANDHKPTITKLTNPAIDHERACNVPDNSSLNYKTNDNNSNDDSQAKPTQPSNFNMGDKSKPPTYHDWCIRNGINPYDGMRRSPNPPHQYPSQHRKFHDHTHRNSNPNFNSNRNNSNQHNRNVPKSFKRSYTKEFDTVNGNITKDIEYSTIDCDDEFSDE